MKSLSFLEKQRNDLKSSVAVEWGHMSETAGEEEEDGHALWCGRKGPRDCGNHGLNWSRRCCAATKSAIAALECIKINIAKRHGNYFSQFYFLAEPQVKYLLEY